MTAATVVTITISGDAPAVETTPARAPVGAQASLVDRLVRVALRGRGDVEARFAGIGVTDVDMRGGFVCAIPGEPYVVRAHVDGRLSISARLRRR